MVLHTTNFLEFKLESGLAEGLANVRINIYSIRTGQIVHSHIVFEPIDPNTAIELQAMYIQSQLNHLKQAYATWSDEPPPPPTEKPMDSISKAAELLNLNLTIPPL